jgi:hypothetical protein
LLVEIRIAIQGIDSHWVNRIALQSSLNKKSKINREKRLKV